jgi:hypothetical protein
MISYMEWVRTVSLGIFSSPLVVEIGGEVF